MILIYSPKITNRIRYAFELILTDILGLECSFTSDETQFTISENPKINYSEKPFGDEIIFHASKILLEKGVKKELINVFDFENTKAFFAKIDSSALPFDPFAAAFYLCTRYEEYLQHKEDNHHRFPAEESVAYKNDFLHQPVVNYWALSVRKILSQKYPSLKFPERKFEFIPTYDIDMAYSYLDKGLVRTLGGYAISLRNFDLKSVFDRTATLFGFQKDPFDTYGWLNDFHKKHQLHPVYFFLVGDYAEYDKNISTNTKPFLSLIKSTADLAEVGIHPSYLSNTDSRKLKMEISRLHSVLKTEITKSRQHYIKLKIPQTYQNLIELDITDDYTMGYPSQAGFRAGIATPFHFYNLDLEIKTNLKIHPFMLMDRTLEHYLKLDIAQSKELVKKLVDETKAVNGTFITLFHNDTFSEEKEWVGWRKFYEEMIKMILKK